MFYESVVLTNILLTLIAALLTALCLVSLRLLFRD